MTKDSFVWEPAVIISHLLSGGQIPKKIPFILPGLHNGVITFSKSKYRLIKLTSWWFISTIHLVRLYNCVRTSLTTLQMYALLFCWFLWNFGEKTWICQCCSGRLPRKYVCYQQNAKNFTFSYQSFTSRIISVGDDHKDFEAKGWLYLLGPRFEALSKDVLITVPDLGWNFLHPSLLIWTIWLGNTKMRILWQHETSMERKF